MKELRAFSESGEMVSVARGRPTNPRLSGFVLGCSDLLVVMHVFDDFEPDGYSVFPTADVIEVLCGDRERHWQRMLKGEGLLAGIERGFRPDLSGMGAAIESIRGQYHHLIIHCEDQLKAVEDFYIGYPLATGPRGIIFRHFDALGHWNDLPETINIADVTLVEYDTPYINRFTKYIDPQPP